MENDSFLAILETKLNKPHLDSLTIVDGTKDPRWRDNWVNKDLTNCLPRHLLIPHHKDILSQIVGMAHQQKWRLLPLGNGTKLDWGKLPEKADILVSTSRLDQIVEYAQEDLVITVQSGVKLKDLQQFLVSFGQFLPVDPYNPQEATIGGIVATANTGSWRQRYGGVRDLVLGVSFIRSDGKEAKAGGKVVKNVAGYDLMKLFTGSYGNLGIITEVTFRLYPLPEASKTLFLAGDEEGIRRLQKTVLLSGLTPTAADIVSSFLVDSLDLPKGLGLAIRFQSIPESVKQQAERVKQWGEEINLSVTSFEGETETHLWQQLQQKIYLGVESQRICCKIGILPSEIVKFFSQWQGYGLVNISSGIGYISLPGETTTSQIKQLRQFCQDNGGFLTILSAKASFKQQIDCWGYVGNSLPLQQRLKSEFDAAGVFVNRL
ncbi:MAG TPA: FAD-binding oxidoreductase [Geminocystis sp. M7585_C2015_104]|nr:FAD-binding oxidoreductase [Geminocystis sp. M7585_C2015_104]